MKTYYLSKGLLAKEYYLDSGALGSHREVLCHDEDFLIAELKKRLDRKRNSILHVLNGNISQEYAKQINKLFSDSKIKVTLESKIN